MNQAEVAWAAGLIDGEGCIQFAKRSTGFSYTASLDVEQRNPSNLYALQRALGGVGTVRERQTRDSYRFRVVARDELLSVLEKIMPHLVFKYPEAQLLRRALLTTREEVKERCQNEIKSLKQR